MSLTITILIALLIIAWGWIIADIHHTKPATIETHFEVDETGELIEITETIIEVS